MILQIKCSLPATLMFLNQRVYSINWHKCLIIMIKCSGQKLTCLLFNSKTIWKLNNSKHINNNRINNNKCINNNKWITLNSKVKHRWWWTITKMKTKIYNIWLIIIIILFLVSQVFLLIMYLLLLIMYFNDLFNNVV